MIAIISVIVVWLFAQLGIVIGPQGFFDALVALVVAALVLILAGKFLPGLTVDGFVGAIIAAISIGVIYWLIDLILRPLGLF